MLTRKGIATLKALAEAKGMSLAEVRGKVDEGMVARVLEANVGRSVTELATLLDAERRRVSRTLAFVAAVAEARRDEGVVGGPDLGVGGLSDAEVVASLEVHGSAGDALLALFKAYSAKVAATADARPDKAWRAVRPQMGAVALASAVRRAFLEGRTPAEAVEAVLRPQAEVWKEIVRAGIDGYAESRGVPAGEVRGDGFSFARNQAFAAGIPAKDFLAGHVEIHEKQVAEFAAAKAAAEHRGAA